MKKLILAALAAILTACGGGGEPVTFTQVDAETAFAPVRAEQAKPAASAAEGSAKAASGAVTPKVTPVLIPAPTTPSTSTTDMTFGQFNTNLRGRTISPGQREVNAIGFNVATDPLMVRNASVQEIVIENLAGTNDMLADRRFVDAKGDVCPRLACYVQYDSPSQLRVVFIYGWRPENELEVFALQVDVSPNAPVGTKFAFRVKTIYMRQYDTSADQHGTGAEGSIIGSTLETMTVVALPEVQSAVSRQIVNAVPGKDYEILAITATCPKEAKTCEFRRISLYTEAANFAYPAEIVANNPGNYTVTLNHAWQPGMTLTWRFQGQAVGNTVYTGAYRMEFVVDGIPVAPVLLVPSTETMDGGQKG